MSRVFSKLHIRRLMAGLAALVLLLGCVPTASADEYSGQCGDSLTWMLEEGTLTIEGSGAMWDYSEDDPAPWYSYRNSIIRLELPEGLTRVGEYAFRQCVQLTHVTLPETVTAVAGYAFAQCYRMTLLELSRVEDVGMFAFSECTSLPELTLPGTLRAIGDYAFSYCRSLPLLILPESVEALGNGCFAYCEGLIRAEVRTSKATLPKWCFAGCTMLVNVLLPDDMEGIEPYSFRDCGSLNSVYYRGDEKTRSEIEQIIRTDIPSFESGGTVSNGTPVSSSTGGTIIQEPDGSVTTNIVTVSPGENVTVTTTMESNRQTDQDTAPTHVDVKITVGNEDGWSEAKNKTEEVLSQVNEKIAGGATVDKVNTTVYVKNQDSIDQSYVSSFAGRDMDITFVTENGSQWTIHCKSMDLWDISDAYDLGFRLRMASNIQCEAMGVQRGYQLRFAKDAQVNAEVKVRLAADLPRQTATLFKDNDGELIQYQSVIVDGDGYAHFYLGSVTAEVDYLIGIGVDGAEDVAIIPENMKGDYGVNYAEPIQYEITGRKSSWGMGIGTVTWIMGGVMLGTVVIVGVVMFTLNKRKLQAGYIPDIGEDEYDDEEE